MGYLKGFFTSLGITYPSFLFIHIYLNSMTVTQFFEEMINLPAWEYLLEVCETAIMEPINVFFTSPNAIRIVLTFLPWVVTAFVVSFFFRKKHAARGGFATIIILLLTAEIVYDIVFQGGSIGLGLFTTGDSWLYGFLVIIGITTLIGILSGLISPFKKDGMPARRIRVPQIVIEEEDTVPEPYYMPTESPSRDQYRETHQSQPTRTQQTTCEFCGSYLDYDTEFCSVCGNRVRNG
jgi:hypothetical protein